MPSQLLLLARALSSSLLGRGLGPDEREALNSFRGACSVRCAPLLALLRPARPECLSCRLPCIPIPFLTLQGCSPAGGRGSQCCARQQRPARPSKPPDLLGDPREAQPGGPRAGERTHRGSRRPCVSFAVRASAGRRRRENRPCPCAGLPCCCLHHSHPPFSALRDPLLQHPPAGRPFAAGRGGRRRIVCVRAASGRGAAAGGSSWPGRGCPAAVLPLY